MPDAAPLPTPPRRYPPLFWVLIGLLFIFLAIGIGSLAYYIKLSYGPPPALWTDPWEMPQPQRITPGLAVWSLAGASPDLVFRQAMAADELDTAAANALLQPDLPSNQRLGWINTLAHRFLPGNRQADARVFLTDTANLAMLLPELPDYMRAQFLVQTSEGWATLHETETATWALEQALILAQYSADITPPLRKELLTDIGQHFIQLGDATRGEAVSAIPVLDYSVSPPPTFPLSVSLHSPLSYPPSLINLQNARQAAAQAYVDDWSQRGGQASVSAARALENSLIDEDLGRQVFYRNQLAREDLDDAARARLIFDQITWLAIKYRAASGLYGTPLVANWQAERPAIGIAFRDAIVLLHNEMNAYAGTLPQAQQPASKVAMDRLLASWSVIGLYVGANQHVIADALNQDLAAWDVTGVFPKAEVRGDRIHIELFYKMPLPEENDQPE